MSVEVDTLELEVFEQATRFSKIMSSHLNIPRIRNIPESILISLSWMLFRIRIVIWPSPCERSKSRNVIVFNQVASRSGYLVVSEEI
ncbi:hypothetical protein KM043_016212 [Ampulex compressa]|nr:hypothetical protein KM043_016212 [Ampulex compressa]